VLLLVASLLIADTAAWVADPPSEEDAQATEDEAAAPARTAEASCAVAAGTRGERHVELGAKTARDGLGFSLGAVESGGPQAAQRQELIAGFDAGPLRGEGRFVPWSSGLLRVAGEVGVHFDSLGLVLDARTASFGRMQMRAFGARVEYETSFLETWHAGGSAAATALSLDAPVSADPWNLYARSTLDWAQRFEASAWLAHDLGPVSLAPGLSFAQPPQESAFEVRGSLAVEWEIGAAKVRAEAGVARLWPSEQLLFDLGAGVTMQLY
jgi:hypothetical protein